MSNIDSIKFDVWSKESILNASVLEVTSTKCMQHGVPVRNGLRDPRFGCLGDGNCEHCGKSRRGCPGHWGHIVFRKPMIHIGMVPHLLHWLRIICPLCGDSGSARGTLAVRSKLASKSCCGKRRDKYSWVKNCLCVHRNGVLYTTEEILTHLRGVNMLLEVLPVPPIHIRPPLTVGNSTRGENDLTYRLLNIVRKNNLLNQSLDRNMQSHIVRERFEAVQHAVACYIDNDKVGSARRNANRREYTSLAGRIKGKEGTMRGHCMGKRVNQSGRCVITGDNRLTLSQIGIPASIAKILTKPIRATDHNLAELKKSLRDGKVRYIVRPNGARIDCSFRKHNQLRVGWVVEQSLQDGDIVLFNRQPSLHKMSIMAHEVKVLPYNTLRFNVACTTPYNADFDGDEMNIHVPQTIEAQAEAASIMAVKYQIVSPQASRPVISVVQDTMLGAYLLSGDTLEKADAFQITQQPIDPPYTGLRIMSQLLPPNIFYEGNVHIDNSVILSGRFRKHDLGSRSGSLIHIMFNDAGAQACADFIYDLEQVTSRYLHIRGFSVGLSDLKRSQALTALCLQERATAYEEVVGLSELEVNQRLNQCRDIMGSAAMSELKDTNQFYNMIYAGSKGSKVNITQIQACIGQQNVQGERIKEDWTNRTMTCFPEHTNTPQSRGFIEHTYLEGLSPHEMYFCAQSGREGLIDTAIKTAQTGYVERRLMKCMENIITHDDGSARDGNTVIQFVYGDDGLDAMRIEKQTMTASDGADAQYLRQAIKDPTLEGTPHFYLPIPIARILKRLNIKNAPRIDPNRMTFIHEYPELVQAFIRAHTPDMNDEQLALYKTAVKDEWSKARVAPGESVGAVAAQSIGERATQCTLNSVDYNEHLVVEDVDTCIGEFIDSLCPPNSPDTLYIETHGRKALTISEDGKVTWNKLIAVTRHLPQNTDGTNTLLKLTTQSGRTLTCTKAKSFLVHKQGLFLPCTGDDIHVGDQIPLINTMPTLRKAEQLIGFVIGTFMATGNIQGLEISMSYKFPAQLNMIRKTQHRVYEQRVHIIDTRLRLLLQSFTDIPHKLIGCNPTLATQVIHAYLSHKAVYEHDLMIRTHKTHRDLLALLLAQIGIYTVMTHNSLVIPHDQVQLLKHPHFPGEHVHITYPNTVNDAWLDTVTHIQEIPSSHKYVYDLTVEHTKNMVLLNGIAIRDTFHFAGDSSKNVTLGLPRLEEILNLTKNIKTPLTTFAANKNALQIVQDIKQVHLRDITHYNGPVKMEDDLQAFWDFPDEGTFHGETRRLVIQYNNPIAIKQLLNAHGMQVAYTEGPLMLCHVFGQQQQLDQIQHLHLGVQGADWCKVVDDVVETSLDINTLQKLIPQELALTLYSNDIHQVHHTLGIEAARVVILREIRKILAHYGIDLSVRHLLLLTDWMTQSGALTAVNRHGLKKIERGQPLKQATFEEVVGVFINAAVHEKIDPVEGISACILAGKPSNIGSNRVQLITTETEVEETPLFEEWVGTAMPTWINNAPESPTYAPESPKYAPE